MISEYLTKTFRGKSIKELVHFLYDLDDSYHWKGGVVTSGLPFLYSEEIEYVVIYEENLNVTLLVKCDVIFSEQDQEIFLPLEYEFSNLNLLVSCVGGMNFENGKINFNDLAIELHGTAIY
jgi:hypothetical protein